jgi:hypothetical protein
LLACLKSHSLAASPVFLPRRNQHRGLRIACHRHIRCIRHILPHPYIRTHARDDHTEDFRHDHFAQAIESSPCDPSRIVRHLLLNQEVGAFDLFGEQQFTASAAAVVMLSEHDRAGGLA